jgi:hypothetical protein
MRLLNVILPRGGAGHAADRPGAALYAAPYVGQCGQVSCTLSLHEREKEIITYG